MPYEDDYKMWLEKMLIESNPDWVCDGMCDVELTHEWCGKHCGEGSDYVTPKCLHMFYHHIARADRKTEPQTIRCPKCGRTDYIRDMEKDMGIKGSYYKYKCINCNFYIKTEPTRSKMEQVDKDINVRSKERSSE